MAIIRSTTTAVCRGVARCSPWPSRYSCWPRPARRSPPVARVTPEAAGAVALTLAVSATLVLGILPGPFAHLADTAVAGFRAVGR